MGKPSYPKLGKCLKYSIFLDLILLSRLQVIEFYWLDSAIIKFRGLVRSLLFASDGLIWLKLCFMIHVMKSKKKDLYFDFPVKSRISTHLHLIIQEWRYTQYASKSHVSCYTLSRYMSIEMTFHHHIIEHRLHTLYFHTYIMSYATFRNNALGIMHHLMSFLCHLSNVSFMLLCTHVLTLIKKEFYLLGTYMPFQWSWSYPFHFTSLSCSMQHALTYPDPHITTWNTHAYAHRHICVHLPCISIMIWHTCKPTSSLISTLLM